jgi:hypothetical protein
VNTFSLAAKALLLAILLVSSAGRAATPAVTTLIVTGVPGYSGTQVNNPLDTATIETYAGTGEAKPTPDGAEVKSTPLNGPRTLAMAPNGDLYAADTENHVIRRIDLRTGLITTVLGTGSRGNGPQPNPLE